MSPTNAAVSNRLSQLAQPVPFGRGWTRPVRIEVEARVTGGELFTSKAGRERPLIVGLPGALCSIKDIRMIAHSLVDHFDLLLVDMPEFGHSKSGALPSASHYAQHVADIVEAAASGREIIFFGQSMGGIVAMVATTGLLAGRVRAIVMLDPPISEKKLRGVQWHFLGIVGTAEVQPHLRGYIEDSDFVNSTDGDGHWGLLGAAARTTAVAILAGSEVSRNHAAPLPTMFDARDEARLLAMDLPDVVFRRFSDGGHNLVSEATESVMLFTLQYCMWRLAAEPGLLRRMAAALAERPDDPELRGNLLAALSRAPSNSQWANRGLFLRLIELLPDDAHLTEQLLRTGYALLDRPAIEAVERARDRARDRMAVMGACAQLANAFSTIGENRVARHELERAARNAPLPPFLETTLATMGLYDPEADDAAVAAAKVARLGRLRAIPEIAGPALRLPERKGRVRVGFASCTVYSRNYLSLAVPLLRALAGRDFSVDLISVTDADISHVRRVLPDEIGLRKLGTMTPATLGDPAAWRRTAEALAAEPYDLLVDMDESLAPHTPGSFVLRPGRRQATWFNMTGPTSDPCFDFAIGPEPIYPESMARQYAGRIESVAGDLYVYEPEVWSAGASPLPWAGWSPHERNGYVTFGSLSNPYKISRECFALWAKVLHAVSDSRLFLGNNLVGEPLFRERVARMAAEEGIDPGRIVLRHHHGWPGYLGGYREIDIVLGTLPVAGGMTMFEAAHLGLPVLSRVGKTSLGRIGRWLAAATGRPGIAHESDDSFVAEAVRLAGAADERIALRRNETRRLRAKSRADSVRLAEAFADIVRRRAG